MKFCDACDKYEDEHHRFENIVSPRHPRPDLCAFLMLHDLVPRDRDMVCSAEHDEFFLDVTPDELDAVATEEQMLDLIRCGVRYDGETDSLAMFA